MITAADADYCPACGKELSTRKVEKRERLFCSNCEQVIWRNPKPAAGIFLTNNKEEVLLIKRGNWPFIGKWSIPAGFIERDEEPVKAAARELEEETSLKIKAEDLEPVGNYMIEHPDGKHIIVITFTADIEKFSGDISAGDDAQKAKFWNLKELEASSSELESEAVRKFLLKHTEA